MSAPEVSIRELRNHGGEVVDRVAADERLTVTLGKLISNRPKPTSTRSLSFRLQLARSARSRPRHDEPDGSRQRGPTTR